MGALKRTIAVAFSAASVDAFAPTIVRSRAALADQPAFDTALFAHGNTEHQTVDASTRREIITYALGACLVQPHLAHCLPSNTGADLSRVGSIGTLMPIVAMQRTVAISKSKLGRLE